MGQVSHSASGIAVCAGRRPDTIVRVLSRKTSYLSVVAMITAAPNLAAAHSVAVSSHGPPTLLD